MAKLVRFRILDDIAVVTLDQPPVNALSQPLRAGLWEVLTRIDDNPDIKAAVLMATGPIFSAGSDIREIDELEDQPSLSQLCSRIESCTKPVVVAVHGQTLGGGAEVMLAGHYRLAASDARIGLPEVKLGLVPIAGGTQRLPRLIGAERALRMMISTQSVEAKVAHRVSLVDALVDGDLGSGAITFAKALIADNAGPRRTRDMRGFVKDARSFQKTIAQARATLADNPLFAPRRVIECVEMAGVLPFEAGLNFESDAFARCLVNPQSIALRHVFVAERKIDDALIAQEGGAFNPVEPMGKAVEQRLRGAMEAAARYLRDTGQSEAAVDGAMVAYGFRRGPFGSKEAGQKNEDTALRIVTAMVVEGLACFEQQAVQRPSDIDALAVHGVGFPRRKGGPFRAIQSIGLLEVRKAMKAWAQDADIWAIPESLDQAVKDARGFDALT